MIDAYFAMSQSLMVPKAEKTDRMSSSVRSLWMLARYNLKAKDLSTICMFCTISPTCCILLPHSWSHRCMPVPEAFGWVSPPGQLNSYVKKVVFYVRLRLSSTLMFLPQTRIPFIWSRASWAASGCSNSTNANPWKRSFLMNATQSDYRSFQITREIKGRKW